MDSILLKPLEAVLNKTSESMFDALVRQIGYALNHKGNIEELKDRTMKLEAQIESVKKQIREAKREGHGIEKAVILWLESAKEAVATSKKIVDDPHSNCQNSSLITRFKLGKKANKKTTDIVAIQEDKSFDRVSYKVAAQDLGPVKRRDALDLESRRLLLKTIVDESLKDANASLIGVYGIAGVGKTELVKHLLSQVKQDGVFKAVTFAKVTEYPDLKSIQEEIAASLDLKFEVNSETVRAAWLCARLKQEEKVLVILDEIWKTIELEDIGIPIDGDHKGCKVVITSRDKNVLKEMGVQNFHFLDVLKPEEACKLFLKEVGPVDNAKLSLGPEIAKRCSGLPMLIVQFARGLRRQGLERWKDSLKDLELHQYGDQVNSALELSYKFLKDDKIKSLFLLCAQIGPDNIDMAYLLKYAIGLGLFQNRNTVEGARIRLKRLISDLKASCWLDGDEEDGILHMTDLVYKFAFSIPSSAQPLTIRNELKERPQNDTLENCMAVSITKGKFTRAVLECPQLEFLILGSRRSSQKIGHKVFEGMKRLKVLHVNRCRFPPWPSSLQFLKDLQTLCFRRCTLKDLCMLGELKKLQVLSMVKCAIDYLPGDMGNLTNLKLLELKSSNLGGVQPNMLSRLTQLEELCMENSFIKWADCERNSSEERNNAGLSELKSPSKLVTLHMHIIDAKMLPRDLPAKQLKSFRILIGEDWDWSSEYETSKMLKLKLNASIQFDKVKDFLMTAEELYFDKLEGVARNVLDQIEFLHLKHLLLQNDPDIQHIISCRRSETSPAIVFPVLESLSLSNLINLEKICDDQFIVGPFSSLRRLKVGNCDSLRNLFSFSMFTCLQQLQEIDVGSCEVMETIVAESNRSSVIDYGGVAVKDVTIHLKELQTLTLQHLPLLASFCCNVKLRSTRERNKKPTTANADGREIMSGEDIEIPCALFSEKIEFPNLLELRLLSINVKKIWPNQDGKMSLRCVQSLTSLILEGCWNLSNVFTSSVAKSLAQLKELKISDCSIMEEVIVTEGLEEEMTRTVLFHKLESLKLKNLSFLRRLCFSNLMECPLLKVLHIENCPRLQALVDGSMSTDAYVNSGSRQMRNTYLFDEKVAFPNLEELHILHMHKLRMIWKNESQADSFSRLKVLKVEHSKELVRLFPANMWSKLSNLEILVVKHCDLLDEVFVACGLMQVKVALKILDIRNLPNLKCVWNNGLRDGSLSLTNLSSVTAYSCPLLKSLFPASFASGLEQLEELDMDMCGIETIVSEGLTTSPTFTLHRLKLLSLWRLEELRNFYPGEHTLNCPILENLDVYVCPKLELFAPENIHLKETYMQGKQGSHPFFSLAQVVPNLKWMALTPESIMIIKQAKLPEDLFHKLQALSLHCFHDRSPSHFPFDILHSFPNIKRLILRCSYHEELFPSGLVGNDKLVTILSQIRCLELDDLRITRLWNQESQNKQVLQDLTTLKVFSCSELVDLSPSFESFRNLTTLYVQTCNKLVNLLKSTTARCLEQLTILKVENCNMLAEIVASEGEETRTEIAFNKLESLKLHCLKSLCCFSTSICNIKFPSLMEAIVTQCPNMKVFSNSLHTPKLKKVSVNNQWRWAGNLNSTIKQLHFEKVGFDGIQHLRLSEFPELKKAWLGKALPIHLFYNLSSLVVDDCKFHSVAVPSKLLPSLNALEELQIRNCDLLEEIFDSECLNAERGAGNLANLKEFYLIDLPKLRHVWGEVARGILDFRSLTLLKINNCSKLKNIFTPTTCLGLVQLKKLEVGSCQMIEEIIAAGTEESGITAHEIEFLHMESIVFEYLPNLTSFSGIGYVNCPNLKDITVVCCPHLKDSRMMQYGHLQDSFPQLERLKLKGFKDGSAVFPFDIFRKFPNLKRLEVVDSDFEMVFSDEKVISTKIQHLRLYDLPALMVLWQREFQPDQVLQHVETLQVWDCHSLATLIPFPTYLPNLTTLDVWDCRGLITLMTPPTAKGMVHLIKMTVRGCNNVTEIVAKEGDGPESCIAFSKLKILRLYRLQSLICFSSAARTIECPSLEVVIVTQCPKMKVFSAGEISAPKLQRVYQTEEKDEWHWINDLNSTVRQMYTDLVGFRGLEHLKLSEFPELVELCQGQFLPPNVFSKLNMLAVDNCVFSSCSVPWNLLSSLNNLEEFEVRNCDLVEEIFSQGIQNGDKSLPHLSKLKVITLLDLPNLKHIFNEVACINLDLRNLRVVKIHKCNSLRYIFTTSMSSFLVNLEEMEVKSCPMVENLVEADSEKEETIAEIMLTPLKSFTFEALPRLINFYSSSEFFQHPLFSQVLPNVIHESVDQPEVTMLCSFQSLKRLTIDGCGKMKYLFPSSIAESLVHLKRAEIFNCEMLEEVVATQGQVKVMSKKYHLHEMEFIKLENLPKLARFCACELLECPSLKELQIQNCLHLETFVSDSITASSHEVESMNTALFNEKVAFPELERMEIIDMDNVKMIWGNEVYSDSFAKLQVLKVECLKELLKMIPVDIFTRLQNLKDLVVRNCYSLQEVLGIRELIHVKEIEPVFIEEIIASGTEESGITPHKIEFPHLESIIFEYLPNLTSFFGIGYVNCPKLKDITVVCCPRLKDSRMMRYGQLQDSFPLLERLKLKGFKDGSAAFPCDIFRKFPDLKRLEVVDCDFKMVFSDELMCEGEKEISTKIQHLRLYDLPALTFIWQQESHPDQILQHVETLQVWDCHSLVTLIPSPTYLPNLTTLDAWDCRGLITLMTPSTAKRMVHLTQMTVRGCNNVTEIVAKEGDGPESCIVFNKLKRLRLYRLQSHIRFSSAARIIECPSLDEVIVTQCPKMKVFSVGEISSPKLQRVYLTEEKEEWHWMKDLHSTIKQMYTDLVGFRGLGLKRLKLSEFPELVELWHGKSLPVNAFAKLRTLELDYRVNSSSSIPSNLLPFLDELKNFEVRDCDSVEEIFSQGLQNVETSLLHLSKLKRIYLFDLPNLKQVFDEVSCMHLDLRNLKVVKIHKCNSLRYIFTTQTSLFLVNLQEIEVKSCPMVEGIIKTGPETVQEITLPLLKSITLEALPRLINICSAIEILQCPSMTEIKVIGCPTLSQLQPTAICESVDPLKLATFCSFLSLTSLKIDGCGNLKYLFPSSIAESLVHLKRAEISNCEMLEEVIATEEHEEEMRKKVLHEIEFIKLENLPRLARLCACELLECPSLKELQIQNCPHLETFVPHSVAAASHEAELINSALFNEKVAFPQLERMEIINMDNVKMIWDNKVYSDSFAKLQVLKVERLKELLKMFPDDILTRLQDLKDLVIRNCHSLQEVFDIRELIHVRETEPVSSQLRKLDIGNLPNLKSIWNEDPKGGVAFDELSSVYVQECPSLQSLFPLSIGKSLKQLKDLDVKSCSGLATIVSKEEGATEEAPSFVFPQLKNLALWCLNNLEYFFKDIHSLECSALKRLSVFRCDRLRVFARPTQRQKSLFSFSEMIPNLEHVSLTSREAKMIKEGHFTSQHFQKVKLIELHCFHSELEDSPFDLLELFHKMEKLCVRCSKFKQLFPHQGFGDALELLYVYACENLTTLAPSSASFRNLATLNVANCDGLVSLVAQSTARSLGQLRNMTIAYCHGLSVIVSDEGPVEPKVEIVFKKLQVLELSNLKSLINFSSVESSFSFPSLTQVILTKCPKIEFFSRGVTVTPELKMVQDSIESKGLWSGSLNATVQELFANQ